MKRKLLWKKCLEKWSVSKLAWISFKSQYYDWIAGREICMIKEWKWFVWNSRVLLRQSWNIPIVSIIVEIKFKLERSFIPKNGNFTRIIFRLFDLRVQCKCTWKWAITNAQSQWFCIWFVVRRAQTNDLMDFYIHLKCAQHNNKNTYTQRVLMNFNRFEMVARCVQTHKFKVNRLNPFPIHAVRNEKTQKCKKK